MCGAYDIPFLQRRVEARKVGELPRYSRRRATDCLCHFYYQRITDVNSSEGYLAVKIEGNDQFFASPITARHGAFQLRIPQSMAGAL